MGKLKREIYGFIIRFGLLLLTVLLPLRGCIEPFEPDGTIDFENALVIEATITNEVKNQAIRLTRTFEFESNGPIPESNAVVEVLINGASPIAFVETSAGIYTSEIAFAAQPGNEYSLRVQTSDGRNYASDPTMLTQATEINSLSVERIVADNGDEGVAIMVDSFDPTGNSRNYRYTYEETYLYIPPFFVREDLVPIDPDNPLACDFVLQPRDVSKRTCYPTNISNNIILTDTNGLGEDRVSNFMVRFINRNNFIITNRYSILIRQLVQSDAAFSFFETLAAFSGSESLFSQIQPGLLVGNVFSQDDEDEIVLGFFDVASVSEQRVFFNYDDLFPGEPPPPLPFRCGPSAPLVADGQPPRCPLRELIDANIVVYLGPNVPDPDPFAEPEGPFSVVPRVCGDCTALGPSEIPDFWID